MAKKIVHVIGARRPWRGKKPDAAKKSAFKTLVNAKKGLRR
jgi:hypothetical protein